MKLDESRPKINGTFIPSLYRGRVAEVEVKIGSSPIEVEIRRNDVLLDKVRFTTRCRSIEKYTSCSLVNDVIKTKYFTVSFFLRFKQVCFILSI